MAHSKDAKAFWLNRLAGSDLDRSMSFLGKAAAKRPKVSLGGAFPG